MTTQVSVYELELFNSLTQYLGINGIIYHKNDKKRLRIHDSIPFATINIKFYDRPHKQFKMVYFYKDNITLPYLPIFSSYSSAHKYCKKNNIDLNNDISYKYIYVSKNIITNNKF